MKKIFQMIGIITIVCGSFFATETAAKVINNMDQIMVNIKNNYSKYSTYAEDAIIFDEYIIPGINGKIVNIDKSYKNMKQMGVYNEAYLIYDEIEPNISLNKNKNLYIKSGNPQKREVALAIILDQTQDLDQLLSIIDNYNIHITFFINETWLNNNNNLVITMLKKHHSIGIYDYNFESIKWIDTVLKNIGNQSNGYCLINAKHSGIQQVCEDLNNYLFTEELIIKKDFLKATQKQLNSGSILIYTQNPTLHAELSTIIRYIQSKGLIIVNIEELISEKIS